MELYEALKVDSPIIRVLLTKVDHIQPLQLTPPISLSHLEDKLRIIGYAIDDVRSQISPICDIAVAQLCRLVESSRDDDKFEFAFKPGGIEFGAAETREWAGWIKTWNEGIELGLSKVDTLDLACWEVEEELLRLTRIPRWSWGPIRLHF
ncbi:MAG: hypothetical protein LQ350_008372 [Teloschistes chrysophthalmus]|nr:MAG: hypothetical protein LQ350_008372 [Niorma chrysophthalma]